MASKMPNGDKWELIDNNFSSINYGKKYNFDFSYIRGDEIKNVLKNYTWRNYVENKKTVCTLYQNIKTFWIFNSFLENNEIDSFNLLTNNEICLFLSYLKTLISSRNNKPYTRNSQKNIYCFVKALIQWGKLYMPLFVPRNEIFTKDVFIGLNRNLKIDYIEDNILMKINYELTSEKNYLLRYGLIILQSTGMRLGDMLKLKVNCMQSHAISGVVLCQYLGHKKSNFFMLNF